MNGSIEEKTESFIIEPASISVGNWSVDDLKPVMLCPELMKDSKFGDSLSVSNLWTQKSRMDKLFDDKLSRAYYKARDYIFPQDMHGSKSLGNRAGDKLRELAEEGNINPVFLHPPLESRSSLILNEVDSKLPCKYEDTIPLFIDICGGPGSWSEFLFKIKYYENNNRLINSDANPGDINLPDSSLVDCHGIGFSLKAPPNEDQCNWYPALENFPKYSVVWGPGNDGNIYSPENVYSCTQEAGRLGGRGVMLAVADGGFPIGKDEFGEHQENYQELYSVRIIMSELLVALNVLQPHGNFVCKLFDTFSAATASVIWIAAKLFDEVRIIKPFKSRIVNSERYLVAKGLKSRTSSNFIALRELLESVHKKWYADMNDNMKLLYESVIPLDSLLEDYSFVRSLLDANCHLAGKQTIALERVLDKADLLVQQGVIIPENKAPYKGSNVRMSRDKNSYYFNNDRNKNNFQRGYNNNNNNRRGNNSRPFSQNDRYNNNPPSSYGRERERERDFDAQAQWGSFTANQFQQQMHDKQVSSSYSNHNPISMRPNRQRSLDRMNHGGNRDSATRDVFLDNELGGYGRDNRGGDRDGSGRRDTTTASSNNRNNSNNRFSDSPPYGPESIMHGPMGYSSRRPYAAPPGPERRGGRRGDEYNS